MNNILLLAKRNLLRYKRRTILTFLIMSFGVALFIFQTGLLKGFTDLSFENLINFETGHCKIRSLKFDQDDPYDVDNYILNYEEVERALIKKNYIQGITRRLQFLGEVDNGIDSVPCIITGIDQKTDHLVFTLTNYITKGKMTSDGIILGNTLAKDMNVGINDSIFITFRTKDGMIDSILLEISGIVNSPDPKVNTSTIFMNIKSAQKVLNTKGVMEIALRTKDYTKIRKYHRDMKKSINEVSFWTWEKLGEYLASLNKTKSMGLYFFVFFLAIIAIVGIINTMLMSVYEKRKEIGTLKALGMTDREVVKIFLVEGAMIGGFGSIVGIIIGGLINWYFVVNGLDVTSLFGDIGNSIGFRVVGIVKSRWNFSEMGIAFFMSMTVSILASYYPAKKTNKLQPAECLKTVQ